MKRSVFFLLFCLILSVSFAQTKPAAPKAKPAPVLKPVASDCEQAIRLDLSKINSYGPTAAPEGPGEKQEISVRRSNVFETEHHTAWYLLEIGCDGEFAFEIVPADTSNDYDFLLYAYTDSTFCPLFEKKQASPLRSNLSNIRHSAGGITGLRSGAPSQSIAEGPRDPYSRSVNVKKGEKYMLVLDNVHPDGKGHTIFFQCLKDVVIKGKVMDSDSMPVAAAEITLSDNKGRTVLETKSDKNGDYKINTKLEENQTYSFSIISEDTFLDVRAINTKTHKDANDIRVMLPKLKKGERYKLGNINFFGDEARLLPISYPSVEGLYKLMKKNKHMIIQIEGHTNGGDWSVPEDRQSPREKILSQQRAESIYNYLLKKGIAKERMSTAGYGSTKILFKNPKNEIQASANRRVEIKVISIEDQSH